MRARLAEQEAQLRSVTTDLRAKSVPVLSSACCQYASMFLPSPCPCIIGFRPWFYYPSMTSYHESVE
jgi:hypothetical protein